MEPAIYRIAPQYRRSAIYLLVSIPIVTAVGIYSGIYATDMLHQSLPEEARFSFVMPPALLVFFLVLILPSMLWSLRMDDRGISRRRWWGWDLWSWDDLASGKIQKHHPFTLVDPLRPWWRRKLNLDCMGDDDIQQVIRGINLRYRLPPPPQVAESLDIKYGFLRSAKLDALGIHVTTYGKTHQYAWDDVERLRITRMEPLRRNFKSIALSLPNCVIKLNLVEKQDKASHLWRGATAEEINEFLLAHVPEDIIDIDIFGQRPSKSIDVEEELKQCKDNNWGYRLFIWFISLLLIFLFIMTAADNGVINALAATAAFSVLVAPFYLFWFAQKKEHRRRTKKLETWLAELQTLEAKTGCS